MERAPSTVRSPTVRNKNPARGRVAAAVSILLVGALLTFHPLAHAAGAIRTRAKGSTDWKTVQEAVRQVGMRRYNAGLTVEIQYLRVQDERAFMTGTFSSQSA